MLKYNYVDDIRDQFRWLKAHDYQSKGTYEIQAASFIADKPTIFGEANEDYIEAEFCWYKSQSLNVYHINKYYHIVPKIWEQVADDAGWINSNYGWCIYSPANHRQYTRVKRILAENPNSRQATMYYTRPSMHTDATDNGMKDHMCTYAVSYHMQPGNRIDAHVYMRSNDAIFGYINDVAWQRRVLYDLCQDLSDETASVIPGNIHWHASSLHIYPRHFDLID